MKIGPNDFEVIMLYGGKGNFAISSNDLDFRVRHEKQYGEGALK